MRINVRHYPSVEAALDAADDGDVLYFPGLKEYTPASGTWQITRSIELYGDGAGTPGAAGGTILKPFDANSPLFTIKPPARNVFIHDMELRGAGGAGSGAGILCQSTVTNQTPAIGIVLSGLAIRGFPGHGVHLEGYNTGAAKVTQASLKDCLIENCGAAGINLKNAFEVMIAGCFIKNNAMNGVAAITSGVALYACVLDGNATLSSWTRAANPNEGQVKFDTCDMARLDGCQFLNVQAGNVQRACVVVDSGGAILGACVFEADAAGGDRQSVVVRGTQGPVVVLSNRHTNIEKLVVVEAGVKDCIVFPQGEVSAVGAMSLPFPNEGMWGGAQIQQGSGNVLTGMILPSSANDPGGAESMEGMLFYNTTGQALRVYLNGAWRTIDVQ